MSCLSNWIVAYRVENSEIQLNRNTLTFNSKTIAKEKLCIFSKDLQFDKYDLIFKLVCTKLVVVMATILPFQKNH